MPRNFRNNVNIIVEWYDDDFECEFLSRMDERYNKAFDHFSNAGIASLDNEDSTPEEMTEHARIRRESNEELFDAVCMSLKVYDPESKDFVDFDAENKENWRAEIPYEFKAKAINRLLSTDRLSKVRIKK